MLTFKPQCPLCKSPLDVVQRPEGLLTSGMTRCLSCGNQISLRVSPTENRLCASMVTLPVDSQAAPGEAWFSPVTGSGPSESHTRTTPATTRTAALDGPELRRLLAESRLSNFLEKQFAAPEYKYMYVLTPGELCDIVDSLGDEALISWRVEPGRLDAQSDVIINIKGKSGGIGPTMIGLYTFDSADYAERVWTNKQILPEDLSLESIKRMLDIRDRTAVNFQSGSYSYTPSEMEQVTSSQLWERLCNHCDTLGIRLN